MTNRPSLDIEVLINELVHDLKGRLPGQDAQYRLAPNPRTNAQHGLPAPPDAHVNGVLILLYMHRDEIHLPLILRPIYPGVHSGQVSLPGGRVETCDANVIDTALREASEEIGVDPANVTILGQLSPLYIGASNNIVHPTVAWSDQRPLFEIDVREVELLIETPLRFLANPNNVITETRMIRSHSVVIPHFSIQGHMLWGATAMILAELLALPSIASRRHMNES